MIFTTMAVLLAMQGAAAPNDPNDILVTGRRLTPETTRRYVNEITRPIDGQLPAFRHPVCPEVIGMPAEHADAIVERVRKVAKHVEIPVAKAGCAPNLRIILVDSAQTFVAELKRQKPAFFAGVKISDVKRLLADQGPALAWSSTQVQNEDGQVFAENASGSSAFDRLPMMRTRSASIINSSTRRSILDSYVVLDIAAAKGKTLMQLADYVTMRALGRAQPPEKGVVLDSILTLFDESGEAPPSMRESDVAYLKALYSGPPTMNSMQQLNRITQAVLKTSREEASAKR